MSEDNEKYRQMLSAIALKVAPWCHYSEIETDDAVALMIAEIYELRAGKIRCEINHKYMEG